MCWINDNNLRLCTLIPTVKQWPGLIGRIQSLSHVRLFATPWTVAHQAFLSFTIFQSLLKFMSTESVMPSNLLILCHTLLLLPSIFPSIRVFSNESGGQSQSGSQSTGALASVLPVNIQSWFPLGLTGLITLLSKGLSRVFSSTTVQKHQFFDGRTEMHQSELFE